MIAQEMGDNGKGIHQLNTWPRALLKLPLAIRLAIVGGTIFFALLFYMLTFSTIHNGYILAIPIILVAWTFKRKGLFSFTAIIIGVLGTFQLIRQGGNFLPPLLILSFISGLVLLIIFGLLIVALRNSFDAGEDARLTAQHAEQQIAIAYKQQRQLNELKNQFILNVNHELRSPLTVVSGYLSLLLDKQKHIDQQAREIYLKSAMRGCIELETLTNDVLDSLTLSNDKEPLRMEDIPIASIAREVVEHFVSAEYRERRFHLDIPEHIIAWGNVRCVRHVLRNLLSNACKYSPQDKPVTISVTSGTSSASQVCISIQDEGPGIPPDQIPLLFAQFVRLKRDLAGTVRGSGLGLYISKNLVEAMDGHIWAESAGIAGQGSRFCFTLPLKS
ncbi:MAG TPA: HAMP domain-containing sensor histidine kinase [Ktedonobacteraceae bacterium]|nr:HAMP domain-containing sensor histidine kinase [Ktedonobacteraceae bacterium]